MGNDFSIYTYSSYSSYSFHITNTDKPYPPAPLLSAFPYIPCHPIYSLPVLASFSFPFSLTPSVVPFSVVVPLRGNYVSLLPLSASRLVGRAVGRSVPPRFVFSSRPCRVVGTVRRFCQLVFVVSSRRSSLHAFPVAASCPLVSLGRLVMACRGRSVPSPVVSVCRPVHPSRRAFRVSCVSSVVSLLSSRRTSRVLASRPCVSSRHCLDVVAHRAKASSFLFRRRYRAGRLVLRGDVARRLFLVLFPYAPFLSAPSPVVAEAWFVPILRWGVAWSSP